MSSSGSPRLGPNVLLSNIVNSALGQLDWAELEPKQSKPVKPIHVKRPMNAFMVWAQAARKNLTTNLSVVNNAQLSKTLGKLWKSLPIEQRQPFVEEAERIREQHKRDYPEYRYQPKRKMKNARYHPYSTPNTSKSSSSPSSLSAHDTSAQSDHHPPLTSSPCSSVFDAPSPSSSSMLAAYPTQPMLVSNLDSSAKENYSPPAYYPAATPSHMKGENDYPVAENNPYSNATMLPNDQFAYPHAYPSYYHPYPHHSMSDYEHVTRYNSYGLAPYDASYFTYPSHVTGNFPYASNVYHSEQ